MHTTQKDARFSHLLEENRKGKLHILCLEQNILLAASEDGVKLDELRDDIKNLPASSTNQVYSSF